MKEFFYDFETRSRQDLKKVGAAKYALCPSTEATLLTWAIGDEPVKAWRLGQPIPDELSRPFFKPEEYLFIAHNNEFDYLIWTHAWAKQCRHLGLQKRPPISNIICTKGMTQRFGAGASLDDAAMMLKLPVQKDKVGKRIMMKQCKPDKTGHFPVLTEQEWQQFTYYGTLDTVLLRQVYRAIPQLEPNERWAWEWTFRENLTGLRIDVELLEGMETILRADLSTLNHEFNQLVGKQFALTQRQKYLDWLRQYMPNFPDLRKETVEEYLASPPAHVPPEVTRTVEIKSIAGSTSVKKVATCRMRLVGDRVYGNLNYNGAFTKRWAGQGLQVHNFPRAEQINIEQSVHSVKNNAAAIPTLYPSGHGTKLVKNLLRRIFIADQALAFYCGDYSKIEPTVLFWLIGLGPIPKKVYEEMAGDIFNKPMESIEKEGEERQLGKNSFLGCFEEDTKVLTSNGIKPIVDVTTNDKLWDGVEWVNHRGLKYQGEKRTIDLMGVRCTPEHLIMEEGKWLQSENIQSPKLVLRSGVLQLKDILKVKEAGLIESLLPVLALQIFNTLLTLTISTVGKLRDVIDVLRRRVKQPLRSTGDMLTSCQTITIERDSLIESVQQSNAAIMKRTQLSLTTEEEESLFKMNGGRTENNSFDTLLLWKDGINLKWTWTEQTITKVMKKVISVLFPSLKTNPTGEQWKDYNEKSSHLKPVFDLLSSGPRHRFTILSSRGPLLVHNSGYGMGHKKFQSQVKTQSGLVISLELSKLAINTYRKKYPEVVQLWYQLAAAFTNATYGQTTHLCNGKIIVAPMTGRFSGVYIQIPSGSKLYYHSAGASEGKLIYKQSQSGKEHDKHIYGGLLTEHVCSATARDIMLNGMMSIEQAGFSIKNTVHDEVWAMGTPGRQADFDRAMLTMPQWAEGIHLTVDSGEGERYLK